MESRVEAVDSLRACSKVGTMGESVRVVMMSFDVRKVTLSVDDVELMETR